MKAAMKELSSKHIHVEKDEDADPSSPSNTQQSSPPPEKFVNTGLQRWEEIRSQWISSAASSSSSTSSSSATSVPTSASRAAHAAHQPPRNKKPKRHAKDIDIDEVIDLIVSNRWRQQPPKNLSSSTSSLDTAKSATRRRDDACFPSPVSLPQMVDVLVDLWEAEGLDI
mmetsp:Transcript_30245/g.54767  ORF Transcript_30245/g.54767 Transcript_30245/m.54767 type:complete len:169 (-) Transcript_30245:295-801(-)